jgi:hypothetical protein
MLKEQVVALVACRNGVDERNHSVDVDVYGKSVTCNLASGSEYNRDGLPAWGAQF